MRKERRNKMSFYNELYKLVSKEPKKFIDKDIKGALKIKDGSLYRRRWTPKNNARWVKVEYLEGRAMIMFLKDFYKKDYKWKW